VDCHDNRLQYDIAGTLGNGRWGYIVGTYDKDAGPDNQRLYLSGTRVAQMGGRSPSSGCGVVRSSRAASGSSHTYSASAMTLARRATHSLSPGVRWPTLTRRLYEPSDTTR